MNARRSFLTTPLALSAALSAVAYGAAPVPSTPGGVNLTQASPALLGRPVVIGGLKLDPVIETKRLPSGREGLPVWFLPRLGLQTRNNPADLWLEYAGRSLRYTPQRGWEASWGGASWDSAALGAPERYGPSVHVSLEVLRALGVPLGNSAQVLDIALTRRVVDVPKAPVPLLDTGAPKAPVTQAPVTPALTSSMAAAATRPLPTAPVPLLGVVPVEVPPAPPVPSEAAPALPTAHTPVYIAPPRLLEVRSSLSVNRNVQLQRVVIDASAPLTFTSVTERGGVTVKVPGASAAISSQTLESGDTLSLTPYSGGVSVRLDASGGQSSVMVLENPNRLVIDTAKSLSSDAPPPINADALPDGISLTVLGGLSLLSFDAAHYQPKIVAAPLGAALNVSELVRRVGGVAGVNGGYFDPPTSLPVDFVASGGAMLSGSLEKRGTVGFDAQGHTLFGFPRPRYTLSGPFGSLNANTVTPKAQANLLSAFVGDGRTVVGAPGLLTLTLSPSATTVQQANFGAAVVPAGLLSFTFDPQRFPQLPRSAGSPLSAILNYQTQAWQGVQDGLSAGPMLLQGGEVVLNPAREAFNVQSGVWRPTRQVAFATYKGMPTLAFLDFGTPETFARALRSAGVQDALRLDSGSSATVFVSGGYLGSGGYLNTVWSRPVPNAIVMVPMSLSKAKKGPAGKPSTSGRPASSNGF